MSEESEVGVKLCPVCEKFEPQAWRKSMCRNCFHSNEEHLVLINGADTGTSAVCDKTSGNPPDSSVKNDRISMKDKITPNQESAKDDSKFGTWPRVSKRSSGKEETGKAESGGKADSKLLKDKDQVSSDKGDTGVKTKFETRGKFGAQKIEAGKDKCDSTSDRKSITAEKFGKRSTGEDTQLQDNAKPLKKDPQNMKFDDLTAAKSSVSATATKLGNIQSMKNDLDKSKDRLSNDAKSSKQSLPLLSKDKFGASKINSDAAKTETHSFPLKSKFRSEDPKSPTKPLSPSGSGDSLKSPITEPKSPVPPKPAKKPERKAHEQASSSQKPTEHTASHKESGVVSLLAGSKFDKSRQEEKKSTVPSKFSTSSEKTSSLTSKFEAIVAKKSDDKKKISEVPADLKKATIDSAGKSKKEIGEVKIDDKDDKQKTSETKYGKSNFTKDFKKKIDSGSERDTEGKSSHHIPQDTKSKFELKEVKQETKTDIKSKFERKDRKCEPSLSQLNKVKELGGRNLSGINKVNDSGENLKKKDEKEEAKHDSTKVKVTSDLEKNKTKTMDTKETSDLKRTFELKSERESKLDSTKDKKDSPTGDIRRKFGSRQVPSTVEPKSPVHGAPSVGKTVISADEGRGKGESTARTVGKQVDTGSKKSPTIAESQVFTSKRAAGGQQPQTAESSPLTKSHDEKSPPAKSGDEMTKLDTENREAQQLDKDAEKLRDDLLAMAERCKHLEEENDKLRSGLTHKERTESELTAQKHDVETTIKALQEQLRSMESRCVKLEDDNSSLIVNIKASQEENQGHPGSEESVALLEKLKTREDLCEDLVDENETLKQEIVDLRVEMDEMYDSFRDQEAEEFRELQKELEITAKNCRILQFKLRKAERRNEQVENERVQYAEKLRLLQNQFESEDARAHIATLEDELNMAKEVSVRLHDELDMVEEKRAKMETENRHLTELLEQADRKQFRLEMEVDKLRDQIHDLKHDMAKGTGDDSGSTDVTRIYSVLRPVDP